MLMADKIEIQPDKMLSVKKIRESRLFPVIDLIFKHTDPTKIPETEIFPFICSVKRLIKGLLA